MKIVFNYSPAGQLNLALIASFYLPGSRNCTKCAEGENDSPLLDPPLFSLVSKAIEDSAVRLTPIIQCAVKRRTELSGLKQNSLVPPRLAMS
ncbi:MAG: hypothetical protein P8130_13745 [Deltaproteobacteria bacterium]